MMRFLLRPLISILTFALSLLLMHMAKAILPDGETPPPAMLTGVVYQSELRTTEVRFDPREYPNIYNRTKALEVVGLARSAEHYHLQLKNNSAKAVVAYGLTSGDYNLVAHGTGYQPRHILMAAGETWQEERLRTQDLDFSSLSIHTVVFDDDSFEGDLNLAAEFVAYREGSRLQSVPVLQLIERVLAVDDADLLRTVDELEAQFPRMPEAIEKAAAMELLRAKYPCFADRMIADLYEHLKVGLCCAKNLALSRIGNMQRHLKNRQATAPGEAEATPAQLMRETLMKIKQEYAALALPATLAAAK